MRWIESRCRMLKMWVKNFCQGLETMPDFLGKFISSNYTETTGGGKLTKWQSWTVTDGQPQEPGGAMHSLIRTFVLIPVFIVLIVALSAEPALAGDAEITLKLNSKLKQCEPRYRGDTLSPICVRVILKNGDLDDIPLDEVPAFRDGRLSRDDLILQAERDLLGEFIDPPRKFDPNEEDSTGHVDDNGRPLFLSDREIAALEAGTGFAVKAVHLDPVLGPSEINNYPPTPPPDPFPLPQPGFTPPPPNPFELDVSDFLSDLHAALSPNVNGYALKLRHQGQTVGILQWNWARNPNNGDLPGLGWNTVRRMHIASISKFMTAIGLMHLLEDRPAIDATDKILQWLPSYWIKNVGANNLIQFDHLMNHVSGFSTGGSNTDWQTMKNNVQAGVFGPNVGTNSDYENMNFGLIRILIATIGGYIHPAMNFGNPVLNDLMWDAITWAAYNDYMQTYVFNPVGAFPIIDSNAQSVLGYRFDGTGSGWDTGNFSNRAGGVGWHMTIGEILDVSRAFRQANIVSLGNVSDILQGSWGLNSQVGGEPTDAGRIYFKAGRWTDNSNAAISRTEQCFVMLMPKDMEIVVFVNSAVTSQGTSLTNIVRTAYKNNISIP